MELKYDNKDNLFRLDGKELFWSSLYLLSKKRIPIPKAIKDMEVSEEELPIFRQELSDMAEMGLIHKDFSKAVVATKKGADVLKLAKKSADLTNLKQKAVKDIDRAEHDIEALMRMGAHKTKLLEHKRRHFDESFMWGPFYLNVVTGAFAFFLLTTLFYFAYNWQGWNDMVMWALASPILAVFFSVISVSFVAIMFHAGQTINRELFRR